MKLLDLIKQFIIIISSATNFLKNIIYSPGINQTTQILREEEEYLTVFVILVGLFISAVISFLLGWKSLFRTILSFLLMTFNLFLVKNKKISIIKMTFPLISFSFIFIPYSSRMQPIIC